MTEPQAVYKTNGSSRTVPLKPLDPRLLILIREFRRAILLLADALKQIMEMR